jgi:anhydro-N-acetylmuramic acid kinase
VTDLAVGLMAGTSLDGVDAALVRFTGDRPQATLIAFRTVSYEPAFRDRLAGLMERGGMQDAALLHVELGRAFAAAARAVLDDAGARSRDLAFVASHGQTVWHEPGIATLQLGDPAVLAEALGVTVVSDFRSRDVAAGGQGAPLVPVADALLFAAPDRDRILLNVGGMANVTWVPAGGALDRVIAFDTGPGVAVLDAVARLVRPDRPYDVDGELARAGQADQSLVSELLTDPYFGAPPPKSTGRERFGRTLARRIDETVRARSGSDADRVATALQLTVQSIADQIGRWLPADTREVVGSGGGMRNPVLVDALRHALGPRRLARFDDLYFDGDAKEAVAFALLGWLTLRGRAGNVPSATGAKGGRVLGVVSRGGV